MAADLPNLEKTAAEGQAKSSAPESHPEPEQRKGLAVSNPTTLGAFLVLAAVVLFGATQILGVTGIYDVSTWWAPQPEIVDLQRMNGAAPAASSGQTKTPAQQPTADLASINLRDQPPQPPTKNLPEFAIRDGEEYDFITDLDSETMKRLGAIQGQLDGLTEVMGNLSQTVRWLKQQTDQQQREAAGHQSQMQQGLIAARQQLDALYLNVQDIEARLKRGNYGMRGRAAPTGTPVAGWKVTAVSGERAWLRSPKGSAVTVTAGERLRALGAVKAVDPLRRIVLLADGRYLR
ncbi:MAG: hypothetical protein V2J55_09255 [Candidatus Competibacteraceae bacterium]|jgi:hypothetical protein|nr:hypothetical protein [Candidatus Competibacteraceae bacterium]